MGAAVPEAELLSAEHLVGLIRSVAADIVRERTAADAEFSPERALADSAPPFAALYGLSRAAQLDASDCRARSQEARLEMDAAHLRLQASP